MTTALAQWKQLNDDIESCRRCEGLIEHCQNIAATKRRAYLDDTYWGGPVGNFGAHNPDLLIVGLAPGAHGANRTGRMFTGDRSGEWLYRALHQAGFANRPESVERNDRLRLRRCAITNICHCAPPDNKPVAAELQNCRPFLDETIEQTKPTVFLALGGLAWKAIIKVARENNWLENSQQKIKFSHGAKIQFDTANARRLVTKKKSRRRKPWNPWLIGSYHPSQQNTFTGRLTQEMFDQVFEQVNEILLRKGNE